jgi:tyrosinase
MGGTGSPVSSGPFRFDAANPDDPDNWAVRIEMGSGGGLFLTRRGLNRNLGLGSARKLPAGGAAAAAIFRTQYDTADWERTSAQSFRNDLEGWRGVTVPGMHNRVHVWAGGDMVLGHSPNDPVFFLHHCNVDRIWAFWQTRNGAETYLPEAVASGDLAGHRRGDQLFQMPGDATPPATVDDMLTVAGLAYDSFDDLQDLIDSLPIA